MQYSQERADKFASDFRKGEDQYGLYWWLGREHFAEKVELESYSIGRMFLVGGWEGGFGGDGVHTGDS